MQLLVEMTYQNYLSWSFVRVGIPVVWEIKITNQGPLTVRPSLRVRVPGYVDTGLSYVPTVIHRGKACEIKGKDLKWKVNWDSAWSIADTRDDVDLEITLNGTTMKFPINLLTTDAWHPGVSLYGDAFVLDSMVDVTTVSFFIPDCVVEASSTTCQPWTGDPPLQAATLALILPKCAEAKKVKRGCRQWLRAITGKPWFSLGDGDATPEQVLQAVYVEMAERFRSHSGFPDIEAGMDGVYQNIRFPWKFLTKGLEEGGATCVDIALLGCAVLEISNVSPLFVLVGAGDVCHALIGCWKAGRRPSSSPVLLTEAAGIGSDAALLVDITSCAKGVDFEEACKRGTACLSDPYQFCYALDLSAGRDLGLKSLPLPRRSGIWRIVVLTALLVLALLGWYAWPYYRSHVLVREASTQLDNENIEQGLSAALRAVQAAETREAVEVLHRAVQRSQSPRMEGHLDEIVAVAFSEDGAYIADTSGDNTAKIYFAADNEGREGNDTRHEFRLTGPPAPRGVMFSPDYRSLATLTMNGTLQVWEIATLTERRSFDEVQGMAFSSSGELFFARRDGSVESLRIESNSLRGRFQAGSNARAMAFGPHGIAMLENGRVQFYDAATNYAVGAVADCHAGGGVTGFAFSPDGKFLATMCDAQSSLLWDVAFDPRKPRKVNYLDGAPADVTGIVFTPDGKTLIASGSVPADRSLRLWVWKVPSGSLSYVIDTQMRGSCGVTAPKTLSDRNNRVAIGGSTGGIRVFELDLGHLKKWVELRLDYLAKQRAK